MFLLLSKIQIKDVVAILILIVVSVLKYYGHDGGISPELAAGLGYYFGHRKSGVDTGK